MLRDALLCLFPNDFFVAYIGNAPPVDVAARLYLARSKEPLCSKDACAVHNWFHADPTTRFELFDLSCQFQGRDRACFVRGVATAARFAQTLFWVAQHIRSEALATAREAGVSATVLASDAAGTAPRPVPPTWASRDRPPRVTVAGADADQEELIAATRFVERWMDLTTWVIQRSRAHPLNCYLIPPLAVGVDRFHYETISHEDRAARGAVDMRQLLRYLQDGHIEAACIGALRAARHLEALSLAVTGAITALPPSLQAQPQPSPPKRPRSA